MSTRQLSLNQRYLASLARRPLLTKAITSAVLAVLNEVIASILAKDLKVSTILQTKLKHPFSWKLPVFAFFAATVSAPVNHYGLKFVNTVVRAPLTAPKKVLQILLALTTFVPLLNVLFVALVSVVNLNPHLQSFSSSEIKRAFAKIKASMKKSLFAVIKSSWITTPIVLTICQTYLHPEFWTVFSNLVYFVLGTGQNTALKIVNKRTEAYNKKKDLVKKEAEEAAKKPTGEDDVSPCLATEEEGTVFEDSFSKVVSSSGSSLSGDNDGSKYTADMSIIEGDDIPDINDNSQ